MDDPADANPAPSALDDEFRKLEAEVFGPDAPRKPDGTPLELGHGSNYAKANPDSKARYHALMTLKASETEVASLTQQLELAKAKVETQRAAIDASAEQAKAEAAAHAQAAAEADALAAQAGKDAEAAQKASLKAAEDARLKAEAEHAKPSQEELDKVEADRSMAKPRPAPDSVTGL